jgi:predicted Na+-dependent transporter
MKKVTLASILMILVSLSSCKLVGDIFKAGVWVGILVVVVVIALIVMIVGKLFGGR